ncbi:hypothetical protein SLH46_01865 [Draconibacterium sp. IB214405]|uniref:hypothetical protein n=1 Tax=Draconibacterium sp. IB214405 TaxID=3097352 RepID=UPI002A0B23AA|nr:hypothetical protein [Draconibacterium sp. IB214405]MDX8337909.1 hypothetical protein [Draconibacterium sp. IB214405]
MYRFVRVLFLAFVIVCPFVVSGQDEAKNEAAELAKKLSNPIASLISLPFQNNLDVGIGEFNGSRNTLNIQPVIPISLSDNLNLISRVILPVYTQYDISGEGTSQSGIGDAVVSAFISPKVSKITWGVGPVFLLPTGGDAFSANKFGIGPTAVALYQANGMTFGGLVNQVWSVDENNTVSNMFLQPFFTYNWKSGAGIGTNLELTQNWKAETTNVWLNPIFTAVTAMGKQKVQFVIGPRFNLSAPDNAKSKFGVRTVLVFLFPK